MKRFHVFGRAVYAAVGMAAAISAVSPALVHGECGIEIEVEIHRGE